MGNVFSCSSNGTMLLVAAASGDVHTAQKILKRHPDAAAYHTFKELLSPLAQAASHGHYEIVQCIVEAAVVAEGPERAKRTVIDHVSSKGMTALMLGCKHGHPQVVEILVSNGADVRCLDRQRRNTALHWAAMYGHASCIARVLAYCSPVGGKQPTTVRALAVVAQARGDAGVIVPTRRGVGDGEGKGVRAAALPPSPPGANFGLPAADGQNDLINLHNAWGMTALHIAAYQGSASTAKALVRYGADLQARTQPPSLSAGNTGSSILRLPPGSTALHLAAAANHVAVIRVILEAQNAPLPESFVELRAVVNSAGHCPRHCLMLSTALAAAGSKIASVSRGRLSSGNIRSHHRVERGLQRQQAAAAATATAAVAAASNGYGTSPMPAVALALAAMPPHLRPAALQPPALLLLLLDPRLPVSLLRQIWGHFNSAAIEQQQQMQQQQREARRMQAPPKLFFPRCKATAALLEKIRLLLDLEIFAIQHQRSLLQENKSCILALQRRPVEAKGAAEVSLRRGAPDCGTDSHLDGSWSWRLTAFIIADAAGPAAPESPFLSSSGGGGPGTQLFWTLVSFLDERLRSITELRNLAAQLNLSLEESCDLPVHDRQSEVDQVISAAALEEGADEPPVAREGTTATQSRTSTRPVVTFNHVLMGNATGAPGSTTHGNVEPCATPAPQAEPQPSKPSTSVAAAAADPTGGKAHRIVSAASSGEPLGRPVGSTLHGIELDFGLDPVRRLQGARSLAANGGVHDDERPISGSTAARLGPLSGSTATTKMDDGDFGGFEVPTYEAVLDCMLAMLMNPRTVNSTLQASKKIASFASAGGGMVSIAHAESPQGGTAAAASTLPGGPVAGGGRVDSADKVAIAQCLAVLPAGVLSGIEQNPLLAAALLAARSNLIPPMLVLAAFNDSDGQSQYEHSRQLVSVALKAMETCLKAACLLTSTKPGWPEGELGDAPGTTPADGRSHRPAVGRRSGAPARGRTGADLSSVPAPWPLQLNTQIAQLQWHIGVLRQRKRANVPPTLSTGAAGPAAAAALLRHAAVGTGDGRAITSMLAAPPPHAVHAASSSATRTLRGEAARSDPALDAGLTQEEEGPEEAPGMIVAAGGSEYAVAGGALRRLSSSLSRRGDALQVAASLRTSAPEVAAAAASQPEIYESPPGVSISREPSEELWDREGSDGGESNDEATTGAPAVRRSALPRPIAAYPSSGAPAGGANPESPGRANSSRISDVAGVASGPAEEADDPLCGICMDLPIAILTGSCQHGLCMSCAWQLSAKGSALPCCPFCRRPITCFEAKLGHGMRVGK